MNIRKKEKFFLFNSQNEILNLEVPVKPTTCLIQVLNNFHTLYDKCYNLLLSIISTFIAFKYWVILKNDKKFPPFFSPFGLEFSGVE